MDPSPTITKAVDRKHRKYRPLVHMAHVLRLKRRSSKHLPVFVAAAAVSHTGEMAPELFTFIEWVTGYRRRAAKVGGSLYDGTPPARVAAELPYRWADYGIYYTGIPGSFSGQGGPRHRQIAF
jgi:hypothetical protein